MPTEAFIPRITIGADPELFVRNRETKMLVSAHDLLPGTKESPYKVAYGAVQVDGVAAEFNIEPAADETHFTYFCTEVRGSLQTMLGSKYELVMEPVAVFDPVYWDGLPKKPKELGCNPDFNAWTASVNPAPDASASPTMRTASGHIHIGWGDGFDVNDAGHFQDCCVVAKQMDYWLGIHSLLWDDDPRRRTLYGKAGCFRPKPYGVEYRTMSNKWLLDTGLTNWIFDRASNAMRSVFNNRMMEPEFGTMARDIIDNNITDWIIRPEYQVLKSRIGTPSTRYIKSMQKKIVKDDVVEKILKQKYNYAKFA